MSKCILGQEREDPDENVEKLVEKLYERKKQEIVKEHTEDTEIEKTHKEPTEGQPKIVEEP